jgi:outer membrane receptor protein involved in Fe transport
MTKVHSRFRVLHCGGNHASRAVLSCAAAVAAVLAATSAGAQQSAPAAKEQDADTRKDVLQEVIVTARKRVQSAQDVAITLNALSAEQLEKQGATDYRDWSEQVPGMTMYEDASANRRGGPTAVIRGVSQAGGGQLNEVSAQATTSYTFGQLPIFSTNIGLYDLNRIEILKGPQGTLFGISSMGGTVRYMPNAPTLDRFSGHVTGDMSSYQGGGTSRNVDFAANIPLVQDKLAVRLSGTRRVSDGYLDTMILPLTLSNPANIVINFGGDFDPRQRSGDSVIHNSNSSTLVGGRAMFLYKPLERWTLTLTATKQTQDQRNKQAVDYNDQSHGWVQSRFTLEPQNDEMSLFSLESSLDVGIGSIEYVGGLFTRGLEETIDFTPFAPTQLNGTGANAIHSALDYDGPGGLPPDPIPAATPFPFQTQSRIVSNELRLQGDGKPLFGGMTFDYVIGVFHMTERRHGSFIIANPLWNQNRGPNTVSILTDGGLISGSQGGVEYRSTAYFADLTLNLTRKLSLSAGARYSDSSSVTRQESWGDVISGKYANGVRVGDDLSQPGSLTTIGPAAAGGITGTSLTPRMSASYKFDDKRMVYFTAAKGERLPSGPANPNYFGDITGSSGLHPSCRPLAQELGVEDDALEGTKSDSVWSYDLGLKSVWLDRRLLADIAVYRLKWKDLQNSLQLSAYNAACLAVIPANVGSVNVEGVELQLTYIPIDSVTLNASVGYTDAAVAETIPGLKDSLGKQLEKGDAVQNVAPWTAAVSAEYRFPLPPLFGDVASDAYARLDWRFRDERLGANLGDSASLHADPARSMFISPAYTLMNFRAGASLGDWAASVYVNNLANKRAVYGSYRQAWFPNTQMAGVSPPRTIGLTLTRRF